jgi:hypothetical protein
LPIVDVELVCGSVDFVNRALSRALADSLGSVFGGAPGSTWVRLRTLDAAAYAENESQLSAAELPAFVTVLHASPPEGEALRKELVAVTAAVAACVGRSASRVHVQYAPGASGRQAFGGHVVGQENRSG